MRARALRAPVFLGWLTREKGRCVPTPLAHRTLCILRRALQFPSFYEFGSPHCLSRGKYPPPPLCLSIPCMYSSPTLICVGGGGCSLVTNHTTAQKLWCSTVHNTHFTTEAIGGFIKDILRGVRCTKSLRVLFLHRRPPSWTTLVLYSRAVFIFNGPTLWDIMSPPLLLQLRWSLRGN